MDNKLIIKAIAAVLLLTNTGYAEEEVKLPKSGSLSVNSSGTSASKNVPDPWGVKDVTSPDLPPISGSVSKVSQTKWMARVYNNTDDTYSVSLAVHQFNRNNTKIKSDSFSYTLRPKQSMERPVTASAGTEQCELDLVSWKKLNSGK